MDLGHDVVAVILIEGAATEANLPSAATSRLKLQLKTVGRCCQTNANSSLFGQSSGSVILQEGRATRLERRCGFS